MKRILLSCAIAVSLLSVSNKLSAQNTYFTEYFDNSAAGNATTGISGSSSTPTGVAPDGVTVTLGTGVWTVRYVYRAGSGCTPTDPDQTTSAKAVRVVKTSTAGGAGTPAFLQTPQLNFGVNTVSWKNVKTATTPSASSAMSVYKSSNGTSWTLVSAPFTTSTACDTYTVTVNDATAKWIRLINETGSDQDVDNITITSTSTIVPVKFESIAAAVVNGAVKVSWNIAAEINGDAYYIERSANAREFATVGKVAATGAAKYSFVDNSSFSGDSYYRIKSVDKEGKVDFSAVIRVSTQKTVKEINVAPNPIKNGLVNLQLNNFSKGAYTVNVYSNASQLVFTKSIITDGASSLQPLQLPATVKAGIYQLVVTGIDGRVTKTIMVQ